MHILISSVFILLLFSVAAVKTVLCPHFSYCIRLLVPVFVTNKGSGYGTQVIQNVVTGVCLCFFFRQALWQASGLDGCYRKGSYLMAGHA